MYELTIPFGDDDQKKDQNECWKFHDGFVWEH